MKANMGFADKMVRISIATLVVVAYFMELISGTTALVLGILAAVFLLTSLINFCPLYSVFGISTKKN